MLLLVVNRLNSVSEEKIKFFLDSADEAVLFDTAVYTTKADIEKISPHNDVNWFVVGEQAEARGVKSDFDKVDFDWVISAMERHDKIVTL